MRRCVSILRSVLFVLMTVAVILPRVNTLSFCNPMDKIMLRACCHPEAFPSLEEGADSVRRPNCCDEIAIPATDSDTVVSIALSCINYVPAYPAIPTIEWRGIQKGTPPLQKARARGPPPDPLPLFIQHCSYRI